MYERWTDELTLEGGYFTVYYNNGSSETVDFTSEYVTFEFDKTDEAEIIEITAFYGNNYPFSFTSQNIYYIDDGSCVAGIAASMYAVLGLLAIAAIQDMGDGCEGQWTRCGSGGEHRECARTFLA